MMCAITIVAAFITGAALSYLFQRGVTKNRRASVKALRTRNVGARTKKTETSKKMMWVCLINGFAWVWCSYILAYLDKPQIAESLSQVAVTEIIGTVLAYCVKSVIENLSKNNHWPDKSASHEASETETSESKG